MYRIARKRTGGTFLFCRFNISCCTIRSDSVHTSVSNIKTTQPHSLLQVMQPGNYVQRLEKYAMKDQTSQTAPREVSKTKQCNVVGVGDNYKD